MAGGRWIWSTELGKLVTRDEYFANRSDDYDAPAVHGDMESFKSPITGEMITDRGQLRRHNREHGVTDSRDYSSDHFERAHNARQAEMLGTTREAKQERVDLIKRTLDQYGV